MTRKSPRELERALADMEGRERVTDNRPGFDAREGVSAPFVTYEHDNPDGVHAEFVTYDADGNRMDGRP